MGGRAPAPRKAQNEPFSDPLLAQGWMVGMLGVILLVPLWVFSGSQSQTTEATGPAVALLALLPALLAVGFVSRARFSGLHAVALGLSAIAVVRAFYALDGFEARRAAVVITGLSCAFVLGSSLGKPERKKVFTMIGVVPLILILHVTVTRFRSEDVGDWNTAWSTLLGNRSDLAEFAWPGVVAGLVAFLHSPKGFRGPLLGLCSLIVAVWFGASPVYAGLATLLGCTAILLLVGFGVPAAKRLARVLLIASAASLLVAGWSLWSSEKTGAADPGPQSTTVTSEAAPLPDWQQSLEVRKSLWRGSAAMVGDHPWSGVGPGQFEAQYPPYRDARERDLSRHGGRIQNEVEVEHPHSDVWIAWTEWGAPLGLVWILLGLAVLGRAWRCLRDPDGDQVGPAVVCFGAAIWGVWNAPLLGPVISHVCIGLCAGMVVPLNKARRTTVWKRGIPWLALLLALAQVPWALAVYNADKNLSQGDSTASLRRALEQTPDSAHALERWLHRTDDPNANIESDRKHWQTLLDIRPHHRGTWNDWGSRLAQAGEWAEAELVFAHILEANPDYGPTLKNLLNLRENQGDIPALETALDRALEENAFDRKQLLPAARFWLSRGFPQIAATYGKRLDPPRDFGNANVCRGEVLVAKAAGDPDDGRPYRLGEQQGYARDHALQKDWGAAVRSYRLALRWADKDPTTGLAPLALRLEMAAATGLSGDWEGAQTGIPGTSWESIPPMYRAALPPWASRALELNLPHSEAPGPGKPQASPRD